MIHFAFLQKLQSLWISENIVENEKSWQAVMKEIETKRAISPAHARI